MNNKRKKIKLTNSLRLLISILIIIVLNILSQFLYTRLDLTTEKRYSLSDATKKFLKNLDDVVLFKVYLEGDFPANYKRLKMETKEMLDEFRAYSKNIEYKFINPAEGKDKKAAKNFYKQLVEKGLVPINKRITTNEGSSQSIIFPGAIVSYKDKEMPLQLLTSEQGASAEVSLNNSIQGLEYNIANIIRKLSIKEKPKIAFITGHGELGEEWTADILYTLSDYYDVERIPIKGKINSLGERSVKTGKFQNKYKAIIIAKPDSAFPEKDKFLIDQYVMRGGKVIWLIDPVRASMDSLKKDNQTETLGFANNLNLDDMLFNYGVRINYNLLLDISALPIPVVTGQVGNQPQQSLIPWYYFPLATSASNHPIVNNLNAVKCEFVSSIDTVGSKDISKIVLLRTSQYSRTLNTPVRISLDILYKKPDMRMFNKRNLPVAVLLEGVFTSNFKGRVATEILEDKENFDFRETSLKTSMIFISDGDIIKNQFNFSKGYPLPLGYDQYTNQTYGNKDFILNCIDYLCDDSGLMTVRSRELKLRLLDNTKINKNKLSIQLTNVALPILIILLFGIVMVIFRKRIYTK
jgi:ABC-2 type transport system permease protein